MTREGDLLLEAICWMEDILQYPMPVLSLYETSDAGPFVAHGAHGCPLYIVCKDDKVAEALREKLKEFRVFRKGLKENEKSESQ